MSLILEIEFLTGVCRAARGPADEKPDWPIQPDRAFSALVSAWAARGECAEERKALEWLEVQRCPLVDASGHTARTAPIVFVPPNDFESPRHELNRQKWYREFLKVGKRPPKKGGHEKPWKAALSTLPEDRIRQPRRFPVAVPHDPVMCLIWEGAVPEAQTVAALDAMARDIGYIGHSASLVRCRFLQGEASVATRFERRRPARRQVYTGRLEELVAAHRANPARPMILSGEVVRVPDSLSISEPSHGWLVLEGVGGTTPDLRAASTVCRLLRQALMSGYRRMGREGSIPEVVSGHTPDGGPTRRPHIAVAPMASAGFPYADGALLGLAIIPPDGKRLEGIDGFLEAFYKIAPHDHESGRRVLTLDGPPLVTPLRLTPTFSKKHSLAPEPYLQPARIWASVTPIVLDRHLKRGNEAEVRALVVRACQNAGLPKPDPDRIRVGRHSAIRGAPPARPSASEPHWTRWRLPQSLKSRQLVHAVVDFEQGVRGPVLLGAGRFTGLGLCRSVELVP